MNLYLLTQDERDGYDTFDAILVCAPDAETAKKIHPRGFGAKTDPWSEPDFYTEWCSSPEKVTVELIGKAEENVKLGIVIASYNAG